MAAKNNPPKKPMDHEVVITRVLDAPRTLVWKAWIDPKQLAQWWGPKGFTNPVCEWDAKPGRAIHVVMRGPDGTDYPMGGTFREVVEPERLVFISGALDKKGKPLFELLHTVTFTEQGGKTTLTVRSHVVSSTDKAARYLSGFEAGMTQSLERLADLLTMKHEPLTIERTFDAPVATVWKALTNKEDFKHWYFDIEDFKPVTGCEFHFSVEHEGFTYHHRCKITAMIPQKKLAYTWRYEGYEGSSLVTFELFAEGNKTRLRLAHEGLETFPKIPSFARTNFVGGWTTLIGTNLKEFVETPHKE